MPVWLIIIGQVVQVLWYLFKYGPDIVAIVKEIIDLIKKLPKEEREVEALTLQSEVENFRKTKDRNRLRRLRDRLHGRCFGECKVNAG